MKLIRTSFLLLLLSFLFIWSCSEEDPNSVSDGFDRRAMLENWAVNFIVSGYQSYVSELNNLQSSAETFTSSPSAANLETLRSSWLLANLAWQKVAMFEIGEAEEITLINFTNIYPVNTTDIISTIAKGDYNLASVSKQDEQGFPAIEYLIYGVKDTDQEIVDLFASNVNYQNYLLDLTTRLETLAESVLSDWESGYQETFINNDGSDATASVNKLVNDYIFYYEKHLRAGKIGIPAGVFSGSASAEKVEGRFSGKSKELFLANLDAMQAFFYGGNAASLRTYLEFVNEISDGENLAEIIDLQFDAAREEATSLDEDFGVQVLSDNSKMLRTYDELQKNVVNLKVDMLSALNIRVDYQDADGD